MPSQTYRRTTTANQSIYVFGASLARSAWTIYNPSASDIYWSNTVISGVTDSFMIPAGGSWSMNKKDGDDTTKEVHVYCTGAVNFYVYEGFHNG